jgi:hypothetical protein
MEQFENLKRTFAQVVRALAALYCINEAVTYSGNHTNAATFINVRLLCWQSYRCHLPSSYNYDVWLLTLAVVPMPSSFIPLQCLVGTYSGNHYPLSPNSFLFKWRLDFLFGNLSDATHLSCMKCSLYIWQST